MKESIFRNLGKDSLLDEVDTCIGIIAILWLLDEPLDVTTIKIQDSELNADVVRNSSYRHLCIVHLKMEEEVLIIDISEKVGIHQYHCRKCLQT